MSGFDRSAFRGASPSRAKAQMKKNEEVTQYQGGNSDKKRRVYNNLVKGKNYMRFFPIHPGTIEEIGFDKSSNIYPRTTHFLDTLVKYQKNGEDVEEIQRRQHLCSKVHGGTPKSLIDEYISFTHKVAYDEMQDQDAIKNFLAPLKNWQTGIMGKTRWVAYTKKYSDKKKEEFTRGVSMLPVSVINKMNELSAGDDDMEDVIETDIFSDPDTGLLTIITSDPEAGKNDPMKYYQVAPDYKSGPDVLTDDDLQWLSEQEPLNKMYINIYKRKDFLNALDALKMFDEKHDLGIFSYDAFLDIVEEISEYYSEGEENENSEKRQSPEERVPETKKETPLKRNVTPPVEDSDLPFDKTFEEMSLDELKGYIRRNKLQIRVLPSYTKEQVAQFIQEEEEIIQKEKEESEEVPKEETPTRVGRSSRLSNLADGLED